MAFKDVVDGSITFIQAHQKASWTALAVVVVLGLGIYIGASL